MRCVCWNEHMGMRAFGRPCLWTKETVTPYLLALIPLGLAYWLTRPSLFTPGERIVRRCKTIQMTALYCALRKRD